MLESDAVWPDEDTPAGRFTTGLLPNPLPEMVTFTLLAPTKIVDGEMLVIVGATGYPPPPLTWQLPAVTVTFPYPDPAPTP